MNQHIDSTHAMTFLPNEIKFGETLQVISVKEYQQFGLPEGIKVIIGNVMIYDSFIMPEGGSITLLGGKGDTWLAMTVLGQVFLTSFEIIPEKEISWSSKALKFFKSFIKESDHE